MKRNKRHLMEDYIETSINNC